MELHLPRYLDETHVFPFLRMMWNAFAEPEIVFNYAPVTYAYPFGSLLLSEDMRVFVSKRIERGLVTQGKGYAPENPAHSYLAHIGFFQHHGLPQGKKPGEARGSNSYMPFETLTVDTLMLHMGGEKVPIGRAGDREAERLAAIILSLAAPAPNHPVAYCLREVIRNVFEHAGTTSCFLCAQRWYGGELEIAVIDRGQGIWSSLSRRYTFQDNFCALQAAINPGVSCVSPPTDATDGWWNSGYGLYVLSQLGSRTGRFLLCSGDDGLECEGLNRYRQDYFFSGTAVKLRMKKPKGINVRDMIRQIVREGEALQPIERRRTPSKSTRWI